MTEKEAANSIVETLVDAGHKALFAGGCVRDLIMNRTPKDYDIATSATPEEVESLFNKTISVGKQFGVMIVVLENHQFEVATFRTEKNYRDGRHPTEVSFATPEEDAGRRDFTVNGLFYDPTQNKVNDYVEGQSDILKKIIRTIGKAEDRFKEDYLRILRAIRFAANLDFTIEDKTFRSIKKLKSLIQKVSKERVRDELIKMFTRPGAGRGLDLLSESGLLKEILPEVETMKGVKQPEEFHPEGDVYTHTRLMMDQLNNPSVILAFSTLLHDIGKPPTFSKKGKRIHFYNHCKVGGDITRSMLTGLRFSNQEIDDIILCVENHMRFADVKKMRVGKLKQLIASSTFEVELELHRIDCLASHGMLDNYNFLKEKQIEFEKEKLKPKRLISGNDLIELGMKPGPKMKKILEDVYLVQLEEKINTKEEAIQYVKKKHLSSKR